MYVLFVGLGLYFPFISLHFTESPFIDLPFLHGLNCIQSNMATYTWKIELWFDTSS